MKHEQVSERGVTEPAKRVEGHGRPFPTRR